jgi:hypothetical protein
MSSKLLQMIISESTDPWSCNGEKEYMYEPYVIYTSSLLNIELPGSGCFKFDVAYKL